MAGPRSQAAHARAAKIIPGGVNSPVRAFKAVGGGPPFIARGSGCRITDIDGLEYIDYVGSWGPLILGHAHPEVVAAVQDAATRGLSFGAPTEAETELAETIVACLPSIQKLRLVNSGTEAVMSAIRLARGATGRPGIVKFAGCYHGHADYLLVKAGSGATTLGRPDSLGVTAGMAADVHILAYNDLAAARALFAERGRNLAAVIVEPVAGNMGLVLPQGGFLAGLRDLCDRHGALLIFDEVMTGFRVGLGGAQGRYGVRPDLTTLGKVAGGGMPLAAYGGRADLMDLVAPLGGVYQAGTLSGNPIAVAAGLATLRALRRNAPYARLEVQAERLMAGLSKAAAEHNIPFTAAHAGAMFGFFFHPGPVRNYDHARACDTTRFATWHGRMLERGIYLAPSAFEAGFIGTAHDDAAIEATIAAARAALQSLSR